jgi:hypothetical protein
LKGSKVPSDLCKTEGCDRSADYRGFCQKHYNKLRRSGAISIRPTAKPGQPLRWLREHVGYEGEDCLRWPFGSPANGYGQIRIDGKDHAASRVMCQLAHGEAPADAPHATHRCGNGHLGCVNPRHLRWAPASENMIEMVLHGRSPSARLSANDVRAIRSRADEDRGHLAETFGVSRTTIDAVVTGRSWAWVS